MTREDAIRELKIFSGTTKTRLSANFWKALEMAIKALEQEPCEDAVSREEVLKQMKEWRDCEFVKMTNPYHYLEKRIQSMSPVTPTRKKGKWERGYSFPDGEYVKCTVCGEIIKCIYPMHYCPNCGAEMEGKE